MNCTRARFLLYAYCDRELSGSDAEDLSRHLGQCPPCAARGESARSLGRILRSRLDRSPAPDRLRARLHNGSARPLRPRYPVFAYAAALLFLLLPLASDVAGPRLRRASSSIHAQSSLGPPVLSLLSNRALPLVSKKMTGTFVCLNCEPKLETSRGDLAEPGHEAGFCADNGEVWRLMSVSPEFTRVSLGRTATVEGVAFPQSGFLRAHRVGY